MPNLKRGDVVWWNCPLHDRGYLQNKVRPVVIISNNTCNAVSPLVTIAPLTTSCKKPFPGQVPVVFENRFSVVMCDRIQTVPTTELDRKIGYLKPFQLKFVDMAIKMQLGLDTEGLPRTYTDDEEGIKINGEPSKIPLSYNVDIPPVEVEEEPVKKSRALWDVPAKQAFVDDCLNLGVSKTAEKYRLKEETARKYLGKFCDELSKK